jgi:hypothetical protein
MCRRPGPLVILKSMQNFFKRHADHFPLHVTETRKRNVRRNEGQTRTNTAHSASRVGHGKCSPMTGNMREPSQDSNRPVVEVSPSHRWGTVRLQDLRDLFSLFPSYSSVPPFTTGRVWRVAQVFRHPRPLSWKTVFRSRSALRLNSPLTAFGGWAQISVWRFLCPSGLFPRASPGWGFGLHSPIRR